MIAYITLMLALVIKNTQGQQQYIQPDDSSTYTKYHADPDWNYDNHGTDWTEGQCKNPQNAASPQLIDVTTAKAKDWQAVDFSFIPSFWKTTIKSEEVINYVKTYKLDTPNPKQLLGFWGTEPSGLRKQVRWELANITFHYPAEHVFQNTTDNENVTIRPDLEMLIYLNDVNKISNLCSKSHVAVISLFFSMTEKDTPNDFFAWQNVTNGPREMDLSKVLDISTAMHYQIHGYVGTFTQPPCYENICRYLIQKNMHISQAQYNYFVNPKVAEAYRQTNLGKVFSFYKNPSLFGTNKDIVDE